MRTSLFILVYSLIFLLLDIEYTWGRDIIEVYVSPKGKSEARGSKNSPFATMEQARDYIRDLRKKGNNQYVVVYMREGVYSLEKTFLLEPADSCITFKSYKKEIPIISGGKTITGWHLLQDDSPEISQEAKGNIWVADISKDWLFHYMFVNGQRAERSKSDHRFWREWNKDHSFGEPEHNGQKVFFNNKEQLKYLKEGDTEMLCILMQFGVMGNGVLRDINPEEGSVRWTSKQLYLTYMVSRDPHERGYRFENALCLIDRPGEWAVDSQKGKVYYWPQSNEDMRTANVIAPKLYELVRLQGDEEHQNYVKNVIFEGITFIYTDRLPEDKWPDTWLTRQWEHPDATLYFTGTKECKVKNCRILHSGSYGITLNHYAQNNKIEQCEIGWTGSGGIFLEGYGPGTLDVNKYNRLVRNYIHDHGLGNYWHSPCIQIYQSGGNQIMYNLLQRSAYSAISMVGVNFNEVNNPKNFFPEYQVGEYLWWKQYRIRYQDFPKEIQEGIRNGSYQFDRETIKPYLHSRNNLVMGNIISEPHMKLNEGGAVYAYSIGKGNKWIDNIAFKSSGMPASSIYALDDLAEFVTVQNNIYWINGKILNGVGSRPSERGNIISGNIRVNYREEFKSLMGEDKVGSWYVHETGRTSLDQKLKKIENEVKILGGWPKYSVIGIPESENGLPRLDEQYVLPKGTHVTIE